MRITLLGYFCRDRNVLPSGQTVESVGGKGLFTGAALARAGATVDLITWLPTSDLELLKSVADYPLTLHVIPIPTGTVNTNVHDGDRTIATTNLDPYTIKPADFTPEMIMALEASDSVLLAPDIQEKISLDTIQWLSGDLGLSLTADIGKYYRTLSVSGELIPRWPWPDEAQYLTYFDRIVVSQEDIEPLLRQGESLLSAARHLADHGPREVVITLGSRGAFIYDASTNEGFDIPAYPPTTIVDPTGAGDTFIGAYMSERLATDNPLRAGKFAAMAASLKLNYVGPLREPGEVIAKTLADVEETNVEQG